MAENREIGFYLKWKHKALSPNEFRGKRGIRTPESLLTITRFPGVPLQPLEHLSFGVSAFGVQI